MYCNEFNKKDLDRENIISMFGENASWNDVIPGYHAE